MMELDGEPLSIDAVVKIARKNEQLTLSDAAAERMRVSRSIVEHRSDTEQQVYGVTTGFGALASTVIPVAERAELQRALLRSHAAGMGNPVDNEVVRAMIALRARSLAAGYSGVRIEVVEALLFLLSSGIVPWVPEHGSLGASGDLAPLAHIATVLTGEGWCKDADGRRTPARDQLVAANRNPLEVDIKEGLALINGTDGMTAVLALAVHDLRELLLLADGIAAMTVEALLGTDRAYRQSIVALRPSSGQQRSAAVLRAMLEGSNIVASHRDSPHLVQDPYSLRCIPQIHGAARDLLDAAAGFVDRELASVVDNPVVLVALDEIASTGNFHGQGLSYAADLCALLCADVAALAERRVNRLLDPARSQGLPAFLSPHAGTNSGFMIAQYTAAACVTRLRVQASPYSVHSLSTSAEQEDHVSMGWEGALRSRQSITELRRVLAIELACAAQALDLREPHVHPGKGTGALHDLVRTHIPSVTDDLFLAPLLEEAEALLAGQEWHAILAPILGDLI